MAISHRLVLLTKSGATRTSDPFQEPQHHHRSRKMGDWRRRYTEDRQRRESTIGSAAWNQRRKQPKGTRAVRAR